jgi:hypothetical protein
MNLKINYEITENPFDNFKMSKIKKDIQNLFNWGTFFISLAVISFLARGIFEAMIQPGREFPLKIEYALFDIFGVDYNNIAFCSFLFDIRSSPQYEFIYLNNFVLVFAVGVGQITSAIFIFTVGLFLINFLKIVQEKVREAISENDHKKLLEAIRFHKLVIELCEKLNEAIALIVFSKYVVMAIIICVIGFQLVMVMFFFLESKGF